MKKVLFVHYRTGERDGVGLEIEKRAKLFKKLGTDVFYLTGYDDLKRNNVFVIKEIDLRASLSNYLREAFFSYGILDEGMMISLYYQLEVKIYKKIQRVLAKLSPDLIFVHNLFSHAYNLPASTALIKILDRHQLPTVVVNHDFWYDWGRFTKPKYHFINEIIHSLPPSRPYFIKQEVINSFAKETLYKRRKIKGKLIGDYFDYQQAFPKIDDFNKDLKKTFGIKESDLFILHATRITGNKAIENAIRFANLLKKKIKKDVVLFFPNFVAIDAYDYFKKIKFLAEKHKINAIFAGEKFRMTRREINGVKTYCFWDSYLFADLVTYTSVWEGFGNQFLEAIYFKKAPIVFEYPVFKRDIKKEGYQYISLGDKTKRKNGLHYVPRKKIEKAVEEAISILRNKGKLETLVEKNFQIAKKYHDESILKKDLIKILKSV